MMFLKKNKILSFFTHIVIFLVVLNVPVFASGNAIETALENCNQVESPLRVDVGCDIHINCMFNTSYVNCMETTLVELTHTCNGFDFRTCVDIATLTMIAMEDAILDFQQINTTVQLNNSLKAFVEGDYQTAIDLYENVTLAIDYFPHYILELGVGIIYLRFDNPDVALIHFDKSLNLEFYNPVAFYYRGNTYVERGNDVRALRDHYMYDLLADSALKATLPLRSFRIQIPDTEPYNLYPVYTLESNTSLLSLRNNTAEALQPIVVSFLDNDETLVIAEWLDIVAGTETEILFFERDPENPLRYILNINQQDVPDSIASGKTEISVIRSPLLLEMYLKSTQGTDTIYITGLASTVDEDDIRLLNTTSQCGHLPFSLFEIGQTLQPLPEVSLFTLWDDPIVDTPLTNLDEDDLKAKPFKIVDGVVCYDNQLWWQVSNGTITAWLPEYSAFPPYSSSALPADIAAEWYENPPTPLQFLDFNTQVND